MKGEGFSRKVWCSSLLGIKNIDVGKPRMSEEWKTDYALSERIFERSEGVECALLEKRESEGFDNYSEEAIHLSYFAGWVSAYEAGNEYLDHGDGPFLPSKRLPTSDRSPWTL